MNNRHFAWPIVARHAMLAPLADPAIFVTAAVGDWGGSVIWNGGDRLALAADNLRARAVEQAGAQPAFA